MTSRILVMMTVLGLSLGAHVRTASAQSRGRGAAAEPAAAPGKPSATLGDAAPPGYDAAVTNALREFELENYAEARSGFLEAHRLYPNARTFRALGMVEFELKNYVGAVGYLEQALESNERPLSEAQRSNAESLLKRARGYTGRYQVSVRPPQANLLMNGAPLTLDASGVLLLSVGTHVIEAEAEGHRPLRRELQVEGGENQALDLLLLAAPVARKEGTPDVPAHSTPLYKKWWLWTTIGVVVAAGAATGLILGLRDSDSGEPSGGNTNTVLRLPPETSGVRF